jgi:4-amino-4-deoxy-L-arabinose transferase-like glycosyltransferase
MRLSRPWLALVLALFCLPLFIDLGRADIQNDEAIYSFGVDRILEIGDWLAPRSSPHEDAVFLEKPPLKFWLVAAPIRFGLLPHNEFGIRFWDALFGAVAFVYVFAIGSRLAGSVCGAVAVLILFVHWPLIFEHGLRQNNMEAPLFLCYCGGMYHYMAWLRPTPKLTSGAAIGAREPSVDRQGRRHAVAVGLYFVLGFMTKFVAALFLPLVLATASMLFRDARQRLFKEWRLWSAVAALILLLSAPWFIYANLRFGSYLWTVILGAHVVTRFTSYLDPAHLHPWYYYLRDMYLNFEVSGTEVLVGLGVLVLLVQTVRRRWVEGLLVLLWFALPVFLISLGTSKLYHYAYPFLPPLALAAGYLAALVVMLAPVPFERLLSAMESHAATRLPRMAAAVRRPRARIVLLAISAAAIGLALASLLYGPVRIDFHGATVFRSSGLLRPIIVAILAGLLAGANRSASRVVVPLLVASVLPLPTYHNILARMRTEKHPLRSSSQCIQRVQSEGRAPVKGLHLDLPDSVISHPMYYYFRRIQPWTRAESPSFSQLYQHLYEPQHLQPILAWDATYQSFMRRPESPAGPVSIHLASPPMVVLDAALLLMPGPYAACAEPDANTQRR